MSSTLRCGKRWNCWNTIPTRLRRRRKVSAPSREGPPALSEMSPTRTSPESNGSRPLIQRSSVLLPPPEGPITAATSPRSTESETPLRTRRTPWCLKTSETTIIGEDGAFALVPIKEKRS